MIAVLPVAGDGAPSSNPAGAPPPTARATLVPRSRVSTSGTYSARGAEHRENEQQVAAAPVPECMLPQPSLLHKESAKLAAESRTARLGDFHVDLAERSGANVQLLHLGTPIGDNQLMHGGGSGPAGHDPVYDYGRGVTWAQIDPKYSA